MPQLFQVLKCFKCSIFQVHQTKKSYKWECKICGEKQSMKRHYGLGTGKECRLHVQKLNGIRREVDEINEIAKTSESSDEESSIKHDTKVPVIKQASVDSKWSEFVEKTEVVEVPEPNEPMYIGNATVVLEVPVKRRKFNKHEAMKKCSVTNTSKPDNFNNNNIQPSPLPIKHNESQKFLSKSSINTSQLFKSKVIHDIEFKKQTTFIPHTVDKKSKWAQFEDEPDGEKSNEESGLNNLNLCNDENDATTDDKRNINSVHEKHNNVNSINLSNIPNNLFALCDENDLDDVLYL